MATLEGQVAIRGSSETMRMMLLTFASTGVTFTWGVEMTYCTPYLLSLGLAKSTTSLIWIVGPLSGLVVQPVVGVVADGNASRWGRRRPLMAAGAGGVALGLLMLGFARELVVAMGMDGGRAVSIVVAVAALCLVDFAVNVVMSCSRSLVIDALPLEKQQAGMAWGELLGPIAWPPRVWLTRPCCLLLQASRMSAVGHMVGYAVGSLDLVGLLGTAMGGAQFQQLTVIASLAILASTAVTCWAVTEAVLVRHDKETLPCRLRRVPSQILHAMRHLPPRIQAICWGQFWSWVGWFPFLFYNTTWIGEIYYRYDAPPRESAALVDMGRIGSTVLLVYSIITLVAAFVLPLLVWAPDNHRDGSARRPPHTAAAAVMETLRAARPHLLTTWMCGHALFAAAMSLAPFARSYRLASLLVYFCGLSWSIAIWAPPALLGVEVNKLQNGGEYRQVSNIPHVELSWLEPAVEPVSGHTPRLSSSLASPLGASPTAQQSGIYSGILNVYTALPQLVSSVIASLVFAILEPSGSTDTKKHSASDSAPNAISVCLFIGALSSFGAIFATAKLKRL
ncbi:hypothetical protein CDD82_6293 [Ophiocordyceps australis]|uniref:Major facilitator superfamily (MFS) profile domain-containing protein n=1 Tax=Ophiocordyceps australis TaxID=1399860 RepID=A0A2C5XGS9_9HYPO|nr:hypothetical protein CDD82_6293 [Ophiocordyceps australis]